MESFVLDRLNDLRASVSLGAVLAVLLAGVWLYNRPKPLVLEPIWDPRQAPKIDDAALPGGLPPDILAQADSIARDLLPTARPQVTEATVAAALDALSGIPLTDPQRAELGARVRSGLEAELATLEALVPPTRVGHRPRVLIRGEGKPGSYWHLGGDLASQGEAATYGAWIDLMETDLQARGIPTRRFELAVQRGRWHYPGEKLEAILGVKRVFEAGHYKLGAWLEQPSKTEDPFFELGRLKAVELMSRAGLVEVIFAGHGAEVLQPEGSSFQLLSLEPLERGDECQELVRLAEDKGPILRFGLCLKPESPLIALSCSNVWGGTASVQHNTASVAWYLRYGAFPDVSKARSVGFDLFSQLHLRMGEATDPAGLKAAVEDTTDQVAQRLSEVPEVGQITQVGEGLWLVRPRGTAFPSLAIFGSTLTELSHSQARQLDLAATTWRDPIRKLRLQVCGPLRDCRERLKILAAQRSIPGWPTKRKEAIKLQVQDHTLALVAEPNQTHPALWIYVARAEGESEDDWVERAARLSSGIVGKRVAGYLVLDDDSKEATGPPPVQL